MFAEINWLIDHFQREFDIIYAIYCRDTMNSSKSVE